MALDYFTFNELTKTNTGLKNKPDTMQIVSLKNLKVAILNPLRIHLGERVDINSAFRSKAVNDAVNGALNSQHMKGQAADIVTRDFEKAILFIIMRCSFDQLILEYGSNGVLSWLHVSYISVKYNRRQVLRMKGKIYL